MLARAPHPAWPHCRVVAEFCRHPSGIFPAIRIPRPDAHPLPAVLISADVSSQVESARIRNITVDPDSKLPLRAAAMTGAVHGQRESVNGYVVFESADSVSAALAMNMTLVDGRHIRVDRATKPSAKADVEKQQYDPRRTAFLGNVHFQAEARTPNYRSPRPRTSSDPLPPLSPDAQPGLAATRCRLSPRLTYATLHPIRVPYCDRRRRWCGSSWRSLARGPSRQSA